MNSPQRDCAISDHAHHPQAPASSTLDEHIGLTSSASAYLAMAYCSSPVAFLLSAWRCLAISISQAPPAGTALESLPSTCTWLRFS